MASRDLTIDEQNQLIAEAVEREESRLRSFIRRRVLDLGDTEDVLQDVFYELTQAYRMMKPAEEMTAWLFRVARNRIMDLFRRKKTISLDEPLEGDDGVRTLAEMLPSPDAGPDAVYARNMMLDALDEAFDELPDAQREVFVEHELLGRSFKEISAATGVSINTLLSRKRYAVLHLRERLQEFKESFATE